MVKGSLNGDLSDAMQIGFAKARLKFLERKAKENGVVIISDKDGYIKRVPAKELLLAAQKASK